MTNLINDNYSKFRIRSLPDMALFHTFASPNAHCTHLYLDDSKPHVVYESELPNLRMFWNKESIHSIRNIHIACEILSKLQKLRL